MVPLQFVTNGSAWYAALPRQEGVHVDIVPLWQHSPRDWPDVLREHVEGVHAQRRVAGIQPDQSLDGEQFDLIEGCGFMVIEFPAHLASADAPALAAFLASELVQGQDATHAQQQRNIGEEVPAATLDYDAEWSEDEEDEFLESVNDPANQLGGHF